MPTTESWPVQLAYQKGRSDALMEVLQGRVAPLQTLFTIERIGSEGVRVTMGHDTYDISYDLDEDPPFTITHGSLPTDDPA